MKIELHMIQNFAPSCLNRDDTGSPKDCEFGGVRRARISSQCLKRAIRDSFRADGLLPAENLAQRTKRLVEAVTTKLTRAGHDAEQARAVVAAALAGAKLTVDDKGQTQYLLFISQQGIDKLADVCGRSWDALVAAAKHAAVPAEDDSGKRRGAKEGKKQAQQAVPEDLQKAVTQVLDVGKAVDLAMFGRMLADMPDCNIDAACQVAHAISTHKVAMDMDFFTAVDDLKTADEDAGAGMMGVVGYNSACFYRYAVTDLPQLVKNLGGDRELAVKAVEAFLQAAATAVPSGKQNTFAAHSRPDFIFAAVRAKGQPLSLANAFVKPARPQGDKDLVQCSADMLADYWVRVSKVYGSDDYRLTGYSSTLPNAPDAKTDWKDFRTYPALMGAVLEAIRQEA